ncbi:MAG TPA: hypothetical protein VGB18_02340 [Candidatus Thermoplasmatota archaeon]
MNTRSPVVLTAIFVLVSGCAGGDGSEDPGAAAPTSSTTTGAGNQTDLLFGPDGSAELPGWQLGDWWDYEVKYNSGESYTTKIVVYSEDGGNYYITSDSTELLMRSAFTHYPTFGPVKKASLEHVIHGVDVPFLKFPMRTQTWEAPYRDFTGAFSTIPSTLPTGQGSVRGFTTTMTDAADGNIRMVNGWSPITKYFTSFEWDFDGVAPIDVEMKLQKWGTNHTGAVPFLEITEGAHRMFPVVAVAPPNPAAPPPTSSPEARATFTAPADADFLVGMFAGAGGPGNFEFTLSQPGSSQAPYSYPWRPTAAETHFEWHHVENVPAGEWNIVGAGSAQGFAFLFLEAYAVKTLTVEL